MIQKLREIAAKRTPGEYRVTSNVVYLPDHMTSDDAVFHATFANCADEILDVLEAATGVEPWLPDIKCGVAAKFSEHIKMSNSLRDALENLRKKVGEM